MLRDEVPKHLRWDSSRFALSRTLFQQNLVKIARALFKENYSASFLLTESFINLKSRFSIGGILMMKYLKNVVSAILLLGTSAWACPDFSGKWVGTCQSDDEELEREASLEISQTGCERFTFNGNGETIRVGLLRTQTLDNVGRNTTVSGDRMSETRVSHWVGDMLVSDSIQMRVSPKKDGGLEISKTMDQERLFFDKDGKLTYRSISRMAVGENVDVSEVICRYQKQ